jgi:hypothetical protein
MLSDGAAEVALRRRNAQTIGNLMRKALTVVGTSLGLLLSKPIVSLAQTPIGVIQLSGGSVAFALFSLCLLIAGTAYRTVRLAKTKRNKSR